MLSTCTGETDDASRSAEPLGSSVTHRLTLRINFLWTLGGNVVYAASQWGILVVLAKLGTPQMVGEFGAGSGNHGTGRDWHRAVAQEYPGNGRGVRARV